MGGFLLFIFGLCFGAALKCYHNALCDNKKIDQTDKIVEQLTHERDELINKYENEEGYLRKRLRASMDSYDQCYEELEIKNEALKYLSNDYSEKLNSKNKRIVELENLLATDDNKVKKSLLIAKEDLNRLNIENEGQKNTIKDLNSQLLEKDGKLRQIRARSRYI